VGCCWGRGARSVVGGDGGVGRFLRRRGRVE
jgi:hypothetical protein